MPLRPPRSPLFPYTTLFRSPPLLLVPRTLSPFSGYRKLFASGLRLDRRLASLRRSEEHTSESSHANISYAVFCLKKKTETSHSTGWIHGPCALPSTDVRFEY